MIVNINKLTKRLDFLSEVVVAICFIFSSCVSTQDDFSGVLGTKAPAFSLYSLDGSKVQLFDYKEKIVVLFFLGNKCIECKAEVPIFKEFLVNPYAGRNDYVVLGLDYWNGTSTDLRAFKDDTGLDIPLLLDAGNVGTNYKITYNRIVVIDKDKNVVFSGTQEVSRDIIAAKLQVDSLLKY